MVFENPLTPWLCRGFQKSSSVGSKKASLHGKTRLVSRPPNLAIEGACPMKNKNSLAHTQWRCKYHLVFAPKYRRQYGK